ncbi:MAG: tRNA uridine-5-carboxymethylaminomethyl(34) synthesis GTPase MnmE [Clostridiales bacterium]|nr:tRNA uridine-5-carboxymethylaminomethyl(34) synthesis GTPase MnmE [Clostridiales bacterium]
MIDNDTIAAISTAPGQGGIGIVRMSGDNSIKILRDIFILPSGLRVTNFKDRYFYYGKIINKDKEIIDEVLVVVMRGPKSYTKEDVVEVHCHGGMISVRRILELVIESGARLSEPGEFTKRAFLNGRLDLAQAEAVADIILSKSQEAQRASISQLEGKLSKEIEGIATALLDLIAQIEASIDYPEEDLDYVSPEDIEKELDLTLERIERLIETSSSGKLIRQGIKTVIVGKPNVGKSSLLNALVKENRAIVTSIPGTTRDVIEELITIKGIQVNITDTAGLRTTEDMIEQMGVERTKKSIDEADLIIAVFDGSLPFEVEDKDILKRVEDKKVLYVINKIDMPRKLDTRNIKDIASLEDIIEISVKSGKGIDRVEDYIYNMVYSGDVSIDDGPIITNIRHERLLKSSYDHLIEAKAAIDIGMPLDLVAIDIRAGWEDLGSITGEFVTDDIIDRIFSNFCLGK